jgi:hypothetical protein
MGGACRTFGERRRGDRILMGNLEETDHLEDKRIDERIILKWTFIKLDRGKYWINPFRLKTGGGFYVCCNEPSGSTKRGEFLDYLRTC